MQNLINSNFNKTYNPRIKQNALSDIKRLLTTRDTVSQRKACVYLIEVLSRYSSNSDERIQMIHYLLDNDITVFLCEATTNLDFTLFKTILQCLRLLWLERRFFAEEHAAQAMAAALRALSYYTGSDESAAVDCCLHFLCDLLNGITSFETVSPLSYQSAYSVEQLLACTKSLLPRLTTNSNSALSSALVLHALISYQPATLYVRGCVATALAEVLDQWLTTLMTTLNNSILASDSTAGMFFVVISQLGVEVFGLIKLLQTGQKRTDFVNRILTDEKERNTLNESFSCMKHTFKRVVTELVEFAKENMKQITADVYKVFLKLLLIYFRSSDVEQIHDFCEILLSNEYLTSLPQNQLIRGDSTIRKLSVQVLGEMLKGLAEKYLQVENIENQNHAQDIISGLAELQYGIEKPQNIGIQLRKNQPYSLIVYIYFYCQSSENPEATAPLLPHLVEHLLKLPKQIKHPPYIIKALWLVFAMSSVSNGTLKSLDERVYLEKATERLTDMLCPEPGVYYTHNPAILLWSFTSMRIPNYVREKVLSKWFTLDDALPNELPTGPLWPLLLNILTHEDNIQIIENCMAALYRCLENTDCRQEVALMVWSMLPSVLTNFLIDLESAKESNISYVLELATTLIPREVDQDACLKTAVLLTAVFVNGASAARRHHELVCLKLCFYLLELSHTNNDNRVLLTYINRAGFLPGVLRAGGGAGGASCAALHLLSHVILYYIKNKYEPKSVITIETEMIVQWLRRDSASERGASLLQLVHMLLSGPSPVALSPSLPAPVHGAGLRALMFRIQIMCCRECTQQSSAALKTLSAVYKYAIFMKRDHTLVGILTSQPWTHALVQFHATQAPSSEFLAFTLNWLMLINITNNTKKYKITKYSMIHKTIHLLKKSFFGDENEEMKQKILVIVDEMLQKSRLV